MKGRVYPALEFSEDKYIVHSLMEEFAIHVVIDELENLKEDFKLVSNDDTIDGAVSVMGIHQRIKELKQENK